MNKSKTAKLFTETEKYLKYIQPDGKVQDKVIFIFYNLNTDNLQNEVYTYI